MSATIACGASPVTVSTYLCEYLLPYERVVIYDDSVLRRSLQSLSTNVPTTNLLTCKATQREAQASLFAAYVQPRSFATIVESRKPAAEFICR